MSEGDMLEQVLGAFTPAKGEGCPDLLFLHHFATGKLSAEESRAFTSHFNSCLYCQREVMELRKLLYLQQRRIPYWINHAGLAVRLPRPVSIWRTAAARMRRVQLPHVGVASAPRWAVAAVAVIVLLIAGRLTVLPALAQSPSVVAAAKQVPIIQWLLPASTREYLQAILLQDKLGEIKSADTARYTAVVRQVETHLNNTIAIDPRYVAAYQALGSLYENWYFWNPAAQGTGSQRQSPAPPRGSMQVSARPLGPNLPDSRLTLAEMAYKHVLQLRPDSLDAHRGLGDIYAVMGEYAKEEREYDAILGMDPNDSETLWSRGWVRLERGGYQGAITDFRESLRRDPKDFDTLTALAMAYAASGDAAAVERTYRDLERVNPGRARLLRQLLRRPQP